MGKSSPSPVRVAVDIGGTFTDLVAQTQSGKLHYLKVPSTPHDPGEAVVDGLVRLCTHLGEDDAISRVSEIVHGTTVGSNTLLQRSGSTTGVLTTRGFRDILEIGRIRTPVMFDLSWEKPEPLATRRHRLEVTERIGARGEVVTELADTEVIEAGRRFVDEGVESVAICFINSHANAAHEQRALTLLAEHYPQLMLSASCDVLPEIKEYERTSTTVVNAYLLPTMRRYLEALRTRLQASGSSAPLRVMTSRGGMVSAHTAARSPVTVVGSGPAGGVIGATRLGHAVASRSNVVFDLGGTTAKASVVLDGTPAVTTEYEFRDGISSPSRFIKGGGYMLKVPAIDIAEVGAGGGSVAWIDEGGLLRVGPHSVGANPGPACYALGNDRPTLTDANVALGYLNPTALVGGELDIDPELALSAIDTHIAKPLGLSSVQAAAGIRHIANLEMARAIRSVTIERGLDPRELDLIACGGGGPVHAAELARLLGIKRVIVTPLAGVFCSLGMLSADTSYSFVRTMQTPLEGYQPAVLVCLLEELRGAAAVQMSEEGVSLERVEYELSVDVRYIGQSSELNIPFAGNESSTAIRERFSQAYATTYGHVTGEPEEIVNVRLVARTRHEDALRFEELEVYDKVTDATASAQWTPISHRHALLTESEELTQVAVYDRARMAQTPLAGPAILEAYDTTILIPSYTTATTGPAGTVEITVESP